MHYVQVKAILSSKNGMNLYRGCQHGCIYCDSRSTCYQINHIFEDIAVKENAISLLEQALKAKRSKCMISTGSMTDPYLPLEETQQLTRRALQVIERYGFGVTILTKSDRILRDLDLLQSIHRNAKAVVQMTLTTFDEQLCRIIEPGVCTTSARVQALKVFRDAGIPTIVWLCPILPYINDTQENILSILESCREAGVKGIIHFGMGLTLRDGSREYFYRNLDRHFPGLRERYIHDFGSAYEIPSPHTRELEQLFHTFCEANGIWHNNDQIFRYLAAFEEPSQQMSLFDSGD